MKGFGEQVCEIRDDFMTGCTDQGGFLPKVLHFSALISNYQSQEMFRTRFLPFMSYLAFLYRKVFSHIVRSFNVQLVRRVLLRQLSGWEKRWP